MNNLCSKKEQDYFVIESIFVEGVVVSAEEAGLQSFILFNKDNTLQFTISGGSVSGAWSNEVITVEGDGIPYSIDGDVLKLGMNGSLDEDPWLFRRSEEEPPAAVEALGGGTTAELAITDGIATGQMSAVCPDGWYYFPIVNDVGIIKFVDTSDLAKVFDAVAIEVVCCLREMAHAEDENDTADTQMKYFDDILVKVRGKADKAVLEQVMATVQTTWDTEQSTLAICEGKDENLFKIRSIIAPDYMLNLTQMTDADSCILFRKDGTVRANLTFSAFIPNWEIEDLVAGTWKEGVMTFTEGFSEEHLAYKEKMLGYNPDMVFSGGDIPFTLEGDILSVEIAEGRKATFRRCNDAIPDFLA